MAITSISAPVAVAHAGRHRRFAPFLLQRSSCLNEDSRNIADGWAEEGDGAPVEATDDVTIAGMCRSVGVGEEEATGGGSGGGEGCGWVFAPMKLDSGGNGPSAKSSTEAGEGGCRGSVGEAGGIVLASAAAVAGGPLGGGSRGGGYFALVSLLRRRLDVLLPLRLLPRRLVAPPSRVEEDDEEETEDEGEVGVWLLRGLVVRY